MVKNLQKISHSSKAIIIDKKFIEILGNPKSFVFEIIDNKIILTPIRENKNKKEV